MRDVHPDRAILAAYDRLPDGKGLCLLVAEPDGRDFACFETASRGTRFLTGAVSATGKLYVREGSMACASPVAPPVWDPRRAAWWITATADGGPGRLLLVSSKGRLAGEVATASPVVWAQDAWDDGLLLLGGVGPCSPQCLNPAVVHAYAFDPRAGARTVLACVDHGVRPAVALNVGRRRWAAVVQAGPRDEEFVTLLVDADAPSDRRVARVPGASSTLPVSSALSCEGAVVCRADAGDRWSLWAVDVADGTAVAIEKDEAHDVATTRDASVRVSTRHGETLLRPSTDHASVAQSLVPTQLGCRGSLGNDIDDFLGHVPAFTTSCSIVWAHATCFAPATVRSTHDNVLVAGSRDAAPLEGSCRDVWIATSDGFNVHGIVLEPQARLSGRRGVVMLHGGPHGEFCHAYDPTASLFLELGYVVLRLNVRGSDGGGRDYREAARHGWDVRRTSLDVAATEAYLRDELGCVAVVAFGESMGGLQLLHAATSRETSLDAVATSAAPTSLLTIDAASTTSEIAMWLGDPHQRREDWVRASPVTSAGHPGPRRCSGWGCTTRYARLPKPGSTARLRRMAWWRRSRWSAGMPSAVPPQSYSDAMRRPSSHEP